MSRLFFISHLFFLVAFLALLAALVVAAWKRYRHPVELLLVSLPVGMIFLTAWLGKHYPAAHQVFNVFYDGLLIYNGYYFRKVRQKRLFYIYVVAILATALDFAMHFVIQAK